MNDVHSGNSSVAMENGPFESMYFLLKMGIFHLAMLVYQWDKLFNHTSTG